MAETNVAADSYPATIRSSVSNQVCQSPDLVGVYRTDLTNKAEYAAHERAYLNLALVWKFITSRIQPSAAFRRATAMTAA